MLSPRKRWAGVAAVVTALLALPGSAVAAQRFAVASGGVPSLACSAPCPIGTAVTGAAPGDEVIVAAGDYDLGGTGLAVPAGVAVHGADGQPRPLIHGSTALTPLVNLTGAGATLRHLAIRQDGAGGDGGLSNTVNAPLGATLADLTLENTATGGTPARLGAAVVMSGSTLLASGGGGRAISVVGPGGPTLHNVTAWASGAGGAALSAGAGAAVTATNTIARAPAGTDTTGAGTFALTSSNYGGSPAPLLANPGAGDFHELPGSPTIDAGLPDPLAGLTDPDGDPRILGATQDIGADEYVSHRPAASTGDALDTTVNGAVTPNGLPTSFQFDYGLTPLYGSSTPAGDAGSGGAAVPVSSQLAGLTPGTLVHYRVVAANADGTTAGLDRILIVPGTLTGAQLNAPHFTSLSVPTTTTVGQPITIKAAGSDRNDPVNAIAIDFDDGFGYFAESACRMGPRSRAFAGNRRSSFAVPYSFATAGVHTVQITLSSGRCGHRRQSTTQSIQVTVLPPSKRLARARDAVATAAANCPNADLLPSPKTAGKLERATLCLINQVRRQNGLRALRPNAKLRRAGMLHNTYMLRGHFFAHQGPGEPPLAARVRKVRYRGLAGENLGEASGIPGATPRTMMEAWMNSPLHRANILERIYRTIGVAVTPRKPVPPPPTPGVTYTTDFGTR